MKFKMLTLSVLATMALTFPTQANDIYIEQVGDNLDLDIVQDGGDNEFGDTNTVVTLNGDDMVFSITQTGTGNDIAATINGAGYTGTWEFTGDYNTVDLKCDSLGTAGAGNCEEVELNIETTGDDNTYKFYIGENSDAGATTVNFTVTGDDNVVDADIDGTTAKVDVVVTNTLPSDTTTVTSANDATLSASNGGNIIDIDIDGDGDSLGHAVDLTLTGAANVVSITQSGAADNRVEASFETNGSTIDITQSD